MKGFAVNGRALLVAHNAAKLKPWRQEIAESARAEGATPAPGPWAVRLEFYVRRPTSRPKRHLEPDKRPDVDKLVRSVLDALTGIVWHDDGQVVELQARKRYATAEQPEGVWIVTERLGEARPYRGRGGRHLIDCDMGDDCQCATSRGTLRSV